MTHDGGAGAQESPDGRTLYYRRGPVIYSRPVSGGPEQPVVEGVAGSPTAYALAGNEIYHLVRPDPDLASAAELRALDLTTGKVRTIDRFQATAFQGLTVSPNGQTVLLSVAKSFGLDLMLVDNFR